MYRAAYRGLLAASLVFLALLAATALAFGTAWTFDHRATLLAAGLGLGAAVALRDSR